MSTNGNDPAYPHDKVYYGTDVNADGLTKRELFAAMALQGQLAGMDESSRECFERLGPKATLEKISQASVIMADALIAELGKAQP